MTNCISTRARRAPSALRSPISRVRSVTATNMMFITPMPPTSSEKKHISRLAAVTVLARLSKVARSESLEEISKSFSFSEVRLRTRRKAATAASCSRFIPSCEPAMIEMLTEREFPYSSMKSEIGIATTLSGLSPSGRPPWRSMVPITSSSRRPSLIFWPSALPPG